MPAEPTPPTPTISPTPPGMIQPEWPTITTDVVCPLCEYNLRGLVENRCPECGYVFDWNEVLHPEIVRHPYLFEHNRKRPVRSFFRTQIGGLRPTRFWSSLRATHRPAPLRLLLYAFLCASALLTLPGISLVRQSYDLYTWHANRRTSERRWLLHPSEKDRLGEVLRRWDSVDAYLDSRYPPLLSTRFARQAWDATISPNSRFGGVAGTVFAAIPACIAVVCWPWLTFVTLMIFLVSMRRANVRPIHVVRCAVYSSDAIWLVPIIFAVLPDRLPLLHHYTYAVGYANVALTFVAISFATLVSYRLGAAYRLYLKFPHARAVAIVSQLIILLAVVVYALNSGSYYY
jgi:hypothetical protein